MRNSNGLVMLCLVVCAVGCGSTSGHDAAMEKHRTIFADQMAGLTTVAGDQLETDRLQLQVMEQIRDSLLPKSGAPVMADGGFVEVDQSEDAGNWKPVNTVQQSPDDADAAKPAEQPMQSAGAVTGASFDQLSDDVDQLQDALAELTDDHVRLREAYELHVTAAMKGGTVQSSSNASVNGFRPADVVVRKYTAKWCAACQQYPDEQCIGTMVSMDFDASREFCSSAGVVALPSFDILVDGAVVREYRAEVGKQPVSVETINAAIQSICEQRRATQSRADQPHKNTELALL